MHLDKDNHIVLNQENSSLKNLVPQLKNNQSLIDSYLDETLDDSKLLVIDGSAQNNQKLYVLSNNPLSCKNLNKKNLIITSDTIIDNAKLNMFHHYISPEQFVSLLGNNDINFLQVNNGNANINGNDLMLKLINNYGPLLIRNHPEKFIEIVDSTIKEGDIISQVLGSKSGQILAEKYPAGFFNILGCVKDEDSIVKILSNPAIGIELLYKQKDSFLVVLNKITNIRPLKSFFETIVGENLSLVDREGFLDISKKVMKQSFVASEALNGKMGKILAEIFPEEFTAYIEKRGNDEILKVLKLEAGKVLAENHPELFIEIFNKALEGNKNDTNKAKNGEVVENFLNIAKKIIEGNFKEAAKLVKNIDFIKDNLKEEKPKNKPKPEKTMLLKQKTSQYDGREEDGNEKGGRY